ncbi:NAD(P)H-binding protein [Plantibacter sp. Mn2098]|uniref:NAD(P)H-binding protein n=1 Tax=Plantibacter sp. Mn2098 TaxID=3395266 RepID=UPI003BE146E6
MRTAIIGGSGRTARLLTNILSSRGGDIVSTTRSLDHRTDLPTAGVDYVVLDLEHDTSADDWAFLAGADAVVFAAGAGYGSSTRQKRAVDLDGAVRAIAAATAYRVPRFVMISSMGADASLTGSDPFSEYLRLKGEADDSLTRTTLDWTIVRPSGLRGGPGTGSIRVGRNLGGGSLARIDLAHVIARVLEDRSTIGVVFDVTEGNQLIATATLTP